MPSRGDAATIEIAEPGYPIVRLLAAYGHTLAILVALLAIIAGLAAALLGHGWPWAAAGTIGGGLLYVLLRSYVELVQIIRETLLPP